MLDVRRRKHRMGQAFDGCLTNSVDLPENLLVERHLEAQRLEALPGVLLVLNPLHEVADRQGVDQLG